MSKFFAFISASVVVTTPAMANRCYWVGNQIYCDGGCRIVDRWWDGYREWMRYSCGPPPELIALAVVILIALVIAGIVASITKSTQTTALMQATDEADAEAEEAQRITDNLKSARAEADNFLETYRRR